MLFRSDSCRIITLGIGIGRRRKNVATLSNHYWVRFKFFLVSELVISARLLSVISADDEVASGWRTDFCQGIQDLSSKSAAQDKSCTPSLK